jgi:hypothetical protein
VIQTFWREHAPPDFHALYGEHEALINILTLEVIAGKLPRRALALTIEWAAEHRSQLIEDSDLCQARQQPKKIPPLEQFPQRRGAFRRSQSCQITGCR